MWSEEKGRSSCTAGIIFIPTFGTHSHFFVSEEILPQTLSVLQTRSTPIGVELVVGNHETFDFSADFFGAILQYPGKYGQVNDYAAFIAKAKENEIKVAVAADILSLVKLKSPGEIGADVVVGEGVVGSAGGTKLVPPIISSTK